MATQIEVAEKLGISERWLRKLIDDGAIKPAVRGGFEFEAVARQYIEHQGAEIARLKALNASQQADLDRLMDSPDRIDKAHHDARRSAALADKAEMDAAEMRSQLVPVEQIAEVLHAAVQVMKANIRSVASKVATKVGAKDAALAERVIRVEIDEVLKELSKVQVIRGGAGNDLATAAA